MMKPEVYAARVLYLNNFLEVGRQLVGAIASELWSHSKTQPFAT